MEKDNFEAGITNIMVVVLVVIVIAVFVGGAVYYQSRTEVSPVPSPIVLAPQRNTNVSAQMVSMKAQNNSNIDAKYQVTAVGSPSGISSQTRILLTVGNPTPGVLMPAHIHSGTCDNIGAVKYPLFNVIDGISVTTIDASIIQLKLGLPLAINIHKSTSEPGIYVACADLKAGGSLDTLYNSK